MKPRNQKPRNQETFFILRESPAPLNIPTPIHAPDRGGPVACLGGPVAMTLCQGATVATIGHWQFIRDAHTTHAALVLNLGWRLVLDRVRVM